MTEAHFIEVHAAVRYWEDGWLNGKQDNEGTVPLRVGDDWRPTIELATGRILDWPAGFELQTCYKVCDAGEYWLLDADRKRIAKSKGYYVPGFLDQKDADGDYIVLDVGADGLIKGWRPPVIKPERWAPV